MVNTQVLNVSGANMDVVREANIQLTNDKFSIETRAIIAIDMNYGVLVIWHDLQCLSVIPRTFPACANTVRLECIRDMILGEFPSVFCDNLSTMPMNVGPMKIHLKYGYKPYQVLTARQIPLRYQTAAEEMIQDLIES